MTERWGFVIDRVVRTLTIMKVTESSPNKASFWEFSDRRYMEKKLFPTIIQLLDNNPI